MSAPNVILILADQQRHDTMGVHGCPLELTPHLDRRAGDGLHLARHYTPHPVCTPARAALWTSRYGQLTGVHRNGTRLPTDDERGDCPTVADVFNDHDYRTGYIGKWHLAHGLSDHHGPVPPEARGGFRDWLAADALELLTEPNRCVLFDNDGNKHRLPGYRTDALTDAAIRYVQQRRADGQPFFLVVSHLEPHEDNLTGRYVGPAGMAERYRGRWMPPDLTTLPGVGAPGGQQLAGLTGGNAGADWADYCAMCRRLDDATQRLTEAVESLDFSNETVFAYTADHGTHFGTRVAHNKCTGHEASTRVPGVIWGGPFEGAGRVGRPTSLLDLTPTLLAGCGIVPPGSMQGVDLRRQRGHEDVLIAVSQTEVGRALATGRWKYGVTGLDADAKMDATAAVYEERYLYDLRHDPYELDNLIDRRALDGVAGVLRERLRSALARTGEADATIRPIARPHGGQLQFPRELGRE